MNNSHKNQDKETSERLEELLAYVQHLGKLNKKPVFTLDEYKLLKIWEHDFRGRIGIQHDLSDAEGNPIWLKIERLKRNPPPVVKGKLLEWITVSNDPESQPVIKDKILKTLSEKKTARLIAEGTVEKSDVSDPLRSENLITGSKDVIFRWANNRALKDQIGSYISDEWFPWAEKEKPRRKTINIYDSLFSLQQTIEAQGEEQAIELIWGLGIARWIFEGHEIDYPLLEKAVEIEIDNSDGAIRVRPRNIEPNLELSAFFALETPGVDALLRFGKNHFSELSEDIEFSPYIHESFEPILRQASTHLSGSGVYWPDINPDQENRKPRQPRNVLEVCDSWLIFARPRSTTSFIQDIERFQATLARTEQLETPAPLKKLVTEPSSKKPLSKHEGISTGQESTASSSTVQNKPDLFFPKPFNDAQVQIIERLEQNDGVVVLGPPGTGKTHTIANIICHYLATGRSVLVTSKGEPALTEVQNKMPDELRDLTISLLTNERQGMKQLEAAVQFLAGIVSQTNLKELKQEAHAHDQRVRYLKKEIRQVDSDIQVWGLKQLNAVDKSLSNTGLPVTAMELAEQVIQEEVDHDWLTDQLGSSSQFDPQFTDSDIAAVREARKSLGTDVSYIGQKIPAPQDMPDSAQVAAIHDDLVTSSKLTQKAQDHHVAPLVASEENAVERAKNLIKPLNDLLNLCKTMDEAKWLRSLFESWLDGANNRKTLSLFEGLIKPLSQLVKQREKFLKTLIEISDPTHLAKKVNEALFNLIEGKKPFGLFSFGHKEVKVIIEQAKIGGEKPEDTEEWQAVYDYILFQAEVRQFIVKWNHIGQELDLPSLTYQYGSSFKVLQSLYHDICAANKIANNSWPHISNELRMLFPHGIVVNELPFDDEEIQKAIEAIELNTSRISLGAQRLQLQDLNEKLAQSEGLVTKKIKQFISNIIGCPEQTSDYILKTWQGFISELERLQSISPQLETVERVAQKICDSGAKQWAELLKTSPHLEADDELTPIGWFKTWQWRRRRQYLREIDGREHLATLSNKRVHLDSDLKRTFSELVRLRTNIGLHSNMTERVQGALMRFVSAIAKIPKSKTAKRAPRHRRDAYRAMRDCYGGVPCWIMPTWRVSESLPSEFGSFDLVIIDEASQSDITALPAIMRAKKLLVVGDDKQVSPTAAFLAEEKILQLKHNFLREQPFSELFLPGVSIYDLASTVFPSQRITLTEHFRCVEPIIRFSMQFYNEQLVPLRIPKPSEKLSPPLIDVYVKNGNRDERKKVNHVEAEAIVEEIKKIVSYPKFKGRSIGVISLIGAQQAKYIQTLLLEELGEDVYQTHKIACGDAATFQGKEKDIIFLSMVVGFGQGVAMSKREDQQRFNVALSRAKDRMYLFRSIQEKDLKTDSDLRLKVLRHFSNPMPQQRQSNDLIELCDSGFERDVFEKLSKKGYNVVPQVKVGAYSIDMVVEGTNDRRLAIELDGDKYHPPEKWMEDWKRQRVMERVGWTFWRCWGSSYTIDPAGCFNDLISTLEHMKIEPSENTEKTNIFTELRVYEQELSMDGRNQ